MSAALAPGQVVVLSSIDWETAWQRHQIFAAQFAAAGSQVFFVENSGFRNPGFRDLPRLWTRLSRIASGASGGPANAVPPGVRLIAPSLLPPTLPPFRRLNAALLIPRLIGRLRSLGLGADPLLITYFPTATTLELIERLSPAAVVYDCASNFRGHPDAPADFAQQEAALLRRCDLVVCDSDFLYKQKKAEHPEVIQIHQGVPEEFFAASPAAGAWQRLCCYGTWGPGMDAPSLAALCDAGFEVTFSGFVKPGASALPAAVRVLPPARREELVRRLEGYEVFLLPYRMSPFMDGVVPAKLYEMLAMGRPVIAAPLPSLLPLKDLLYIAESPADWVRIAKDLPRTESAIRREARIALARKHTHAAEFARLWEGIRGVLDKKRAA